MKHYHRFALYYAPARSAFLEQAEAWLGRSACLDHHAAPLDLEAAGFSALTPEQRAEQWRITAEPRRYGFHATLKPPFRLREGQTALALCAELDAFAATCAPVTLVEGLKFAQIGSFFALIPAVESHDLAAFAARVVRHFEPFRAELNPSEMARRLRANLSPRQIELLGQWGYPYVMEEFRFHLTLSDRLTAEEAAFWAPLLQARFEPLLPRPLVIADLCLFGQEEGGDFELIHRAPLTGTTA